MDVRPRSGATAPSCSSRRTSAAPAAPARTASGTAAGRVNGPDLFEGGGDQASTFVCNTERKKIGPKINILNFNRMLMG